MLSRFSHSCCFLTPALVLTLLFIFHRSGFNLCFHRLSVLSVFLGVGFGGVLFSWGFPVLCRMLYQLKSLRILLINAIFVVIGHDLAKITFNGFIIPLYYQNRPPFFFSKTASIISSIGLSSEVVNNANIGKRGYWLKHKHSFVLSTKPLTIIPFFCFAPLFCKGRVAPVIAIIPFRSIIAF